MENENMLIGEELLERVAGGSSGSDNGLYVWPVPGFHSIVMGFMDGPGMRSNRGIDISDAGIFGAAVVAAAGGIVSLCGDGYGGGLGIHCLIDHENGKQTLYAHLNSSFVHAGERVAKGQVIGSVGATGDATGPMLHFETRMAGICYDPMSEF